MIDKPFEIKFDKTPTLIYIQNESHGIGEVYLNGKRLTGLQEIEIKAETKQVFSPELKLKIILEKLADFGM